MQGLSVEEAPFGRDVDNPKQQCRCCVIHLRFHELSEYPEEVDLNWQELLDTVEGPFASAVDSVIQKCFRKAAFTAGVEQVAVTEEGKGAGVGSKGDRGGKQGEEGEQAAHSVADINDAGEKEEDENQEVGDFTICHMPMRARLTTQLWNIRNKTKSVVMTFFVNNNMQLFSSLVFCCSCRQFVASFDKPMGCMLWAMRSTRLAIFVVLFFALFVNACILLLLLLCGSGALTLTGIHAYFMVLPKAWVNCYMPCIIISQDNSMCVQSQRKLHWD